MGNVRVIALKDIAKYMRDEGIQIQDESGDVWMVTASRIDCKEQRKLNIELGINKVNFTKEAMTRKRKVKKEQP